MRIVSVRALVALLLVALPVCWGAVFPDKAFIGNIESLAAVPETVKILLFGMVLLGLASSMRVRLTR